MALDGEVVYEYLRETNNDKLIKLTIGSANYLLDNWEQAGNLIGGHDHIELLAVSLLGCVPIERVRG